MTTLLSAAEVAKNLGVKTQTVREWFHRGEIPGTVLPSGFMRFDMTEIEKWLKSRTIKKTKDVLA